MDDIGDFRNHLDHCPDSERERTKWRASAAFGRTRIVHKRFAIETLMTAIRTVAEGLVWMPPTVQSEFAAQGSSTSKRLTARELEIVRFVAIGLRNAEVGERLTISESTVKTHLNNIFQKLACATGLNWLITRSRPGWWR